MSVSFASRWGTLPIKRVSTKIGSGKTPSGGAENYPTEGIFFLRSQNVHFDGLRLDDVVYIDRETHREMRGTHVSPGDVLLNITGASLGRTTYVPASLGPANVNQHVCIIRPGADTESRYLAYSLASLPGQQQIFELQVGGNRDGLNFEQVGGLLVPAAPLDEQRRIADFLDAETSRIDRLLTLQTTVLERLDERQSAIVDLAIDELIDRVGTTPFRRFIVAMDQGASPQCDAVPASDDEWGVLKVSCLRPGSFFPDQNKRLPEGVVPDARSEVREGDVLITRANTPQLVGSTAVVPAVRRKLLLSDKIFRVGLSPLLNAHYVAWIARGTRVRSFSSASSNGASQSMANIRFEEVKEWPIPHIDLPEQNRVVAELDRSRVQTEALRSRITRQLTLLAERRQALITAAVTGQFDVSTASGRGED